MSQNSNVYIRGTLLSVVTQLVGMVEELVYHRVVNIDVSGKTISGNSASVRNLCAVQ